MKLSQLLASRKVILRHAALANLAHAFRTLKLLTRRIEASRLRGTVTLQQVDTDAERYEITLTAVDFHQSILEEHFSDRDIVELADALEFAESCAEPLTFRLEEIAARFLGPLAVELARAGVKIDWTDKQPDARSPLASETEPARDAESSDSK